MPNQEMKKDEPAVVPAVVRTRADALAILRKFGGQSAYAISRETCMVETGALIDKAATILKDKNHKESLIISDAMLKTLRQEFEEEAKSPPVATKPKGKVVFDQIAKSW